MPANKLLHLWAALVAQDPEATAVIDGESGKVWSRQALDRLAETWAEKATAAGLRKGQRLLFAEANSAAWFGPFLGSLRIGAIPVPADHAEHADNLAVLAPKIGARWLWHRGEFSQLAASTPKRRAGVSLIKLTSGSEGVPKVRLFTQAQLVADGRQVCSSMEIGPSDLSLGLIPLGHSYGLGNLVIPLLIQGSPVLCAGAPLPNVLASLCRKYKPTVFPAVPTLLRALSQAEVHAADFSSLRLIISAGALLSAETAQAFHQKFGILIHNFYGSSETGGITFDRMGQSTLQGLSVGTPMDGVRILWGKDGRFKVASAAVMGSGAWAMPDLARQTEDGEIVLVGRRGRMVKIGARRLNLTEVEAALRALPEVKDAFVIPHPSKADALAAAVQSELGSAELRRLLQRRLAAWKIPERILALREFPSTSRGKRDRQALERLLRA